jgi:hypothetical protein
MNRLFELFEWNCASLPCCEFYTAIGPTHANKEGWRSGHAKAIPFLAIETHLLGCLASIDTLRKYPIVQTYCRGVTLETRWLECLRIGYQLFMHLPEPVLTASAFESLSRLLCPWMNVKRKIEERLLDDSCVYEFLLNSRSRCLVVSGAERALVITEFNSTSRPPPRAGDTLSAARLSPCTFSTRCCAAGLDGT